ATTAPPLTNTSCELYSSYVHTIYTVVTLAVETLAGAARLLAATRGPAAASLLFNLFEVPCGDSDQGGPSSAFTVLSSCNSTTVVMTPTDCNQ
ncbi:hypothetical protein HaLaN_06929, partial [Haematococcus lacustris]